MKSPLIAHIILNLDVGGLETGLVNLINHMPDGYRHAIICLGYASEFRDRISRSGVKVYELHKREGKDFALYFRLWKLLRQLRPDIVHTRDFAALDSIVAVALAGVRYRVHSLHGWRMKHTRKYRILHRSLKFLIDRHITVSQDLACWLQDTIGIPAQQVRAVCNGVDSELFHPSAEKLDLSKDAGVQFGADKFIVGTVGRLVPVKDQITLIKAFSKLIHERPTLSDKLRLVIVGDGPLKKQLRGTLEQEGVSAKAWLAGTRNDVPTLMQGMDLFVLPSISEGISNTILEAMASGLPVIATRVGGSPELVEEGTTGQLVPVSDAAALANAIEAYAVTPDLAATAGRSGKQRVDQHFSMNIMANQYARVYDELLSSSRMVSRVSR